MGYCIHLFNQMFKIARLGKASDSGTQATGIGINRLIEIVYSLEFLEIFKGDMRW